MWTWRRQVHMVLPRTTRWFDQLSVHNPISAGAVRSWEPTKNNLARRELTRFPAFQSNLSGFGSINPAFPTQSQRVGFDQPSVPNPISAGWALSTDRSQSNVTGLGCINPAFPIQSPWVWFDQPSVPNPISAGWALSTDRSQSNVTGLGCINPAFPINLRGFGSINPAFPIQSKQVEFDHVSKIFKSHTGL